MFIIFSAASFGLLFLLARTRFRPFLSGTRESFLAAAVGWASVSILTVEILSAFHRLEFRTLASFWLVFTGLLGWICVRFERPSSDLKRIFDLFPVRSMTIEEKLFAAGLLGISAMTLLIALVSPPNTWDSLTYHMSRVAHWIQNRTAGYYATNNLRQLVYTPGAEYLILQLQILGGSDRFANLPQWFSMIGSAAGISLIAKKLNASRREQLLAAVFSSTVPMGILQSTGTQTDYVMTFGLVGFVYFMLCALSTENKMPPVLAALGGLSLGLACLTKGLSYIYALPFALLFLTEGFRKHRLGVIKPAVIVLVTAVILNAGTFRRMHEFANEKDNVSLDLAMQLKNQTISVPVILSNAVRNLSLHFGTPSTMINAAHRAFIENLHDGLGIRINDPRTTYGDDFLIPGHPLHEDNAGNPLHLIIITAALLILPLSRKTRGKIFLWTYFGCVFTGFLLLCVIFKWQPWNSRFHLPLFILSAPWAVLILSSALPRKTLTVLGTLLIAAGIPWLVFNESRPVFGKKNIFNAPRVDQYFMNNPGFIYSYRSAIEEIEKDKCSQIGLTLGGNSWEYPLWAMLPDRPRKSFRLEYVNIENASAGRLPLGAFDPCIVIDDLSSDRVEITVGGKTFYQTRRMPFLNVFKPDVDGTLKRKASLLYFTRSLQDAQKILTLLRQIVPENQNGLEKLSRETGLALAAAVKVDMENLREKNPGLAEEYQKFVDGLRRLKNGCVDLDLNELREGQMEISAWLAWLLQNRDSVDRALEGSGR